MSTNLTATLPNLVFTADAVTGPAPAAPTLSVGALAWSEVVEEASVDEASVDEPLILAPAVSTSTRQPRRAALAALLFGVVTVGAAVGAIVLGGNDFPSSPVGVADRTESAPHVAPAPAATPSGSRTVVPVAVAQISVPAMAPTKLSAPTQPIATPPVVPPVTPTQHRDWPHWNWHRHDRQDDKY
ncbi:hypothetical protein FZI85_26475 [Mycobacterium sp. CBMA293]|uniref:hypothetical protein n=1 Tax=unclassified Mycolicibacterium TaxID=2636767 RepID=UPI0012DF1A47|nr:MULTISPECIES: hypothetical protein [unclassified Mycolicibacterium]MUL48556.1 hypothetical protein [Mycolicibacterium sp. CBMA 360]MUL62013.1 hypothetical protein [Mycolicibacterium sp. CBMA 335]MUL73288.1 hypothetical protein [Mycolicibacterium sp. CBMA 311]MUL96457.1 hypothetical protein [Mycolicibacterium sp. CBMA 230]MUM05352.1 hypothetical protein [Mycolicibacterium sp. CBMA 213]